jgi:uncharacterized membrane protein YphA (DoxX/SURF4 family)
MRWALGGLFIWTGLSKLQQPYDFLFSVYGYELAGPGLGLALACVLPWVEVTLGISLVIGLLDRGALLLSVVLLALFTYARASAVLQDLPIPCG